VVLVHFDAEMHLAWHPLFDLTLELMCFALIPDDDGFALDHRALQLARRHRLEGLRRDHRDGLYTPSASAVILILSQLSSPWTRHHTTPSMLFWEKNVTS